MTKTLWSRARGRSATRADDSANLTIDEYIALVGAALPGFSNPIQGVTFTQGGQGTEPVPDDFRAMATRMFGSNSVVFACMLARLAVFSSIRFQYQRFRDGRPSTLFGNPSLGILERPWLGGSTSKLLARMITDADLAGNAYIAAIGDEMVRMRPDWVDILLAPRVVIQNGVPAGTVGWRKVGYAYYEDGIRDSEPTVFLPNEVCHFAPIPDPTATYRGMSWLTPLIREVSSDDSMTVHKSKFMRNAATPNLVISHQPQVTGAQALAFKRVMESEYTGVENAGKTLHVGGGADVTVVGKDFTQIDLRGVQGAGETRIAAAAGTPPIIVGLSEGLQAATYSNYGQARRRFADATMHPLWGDVAGALEVVRPAPPASRLWYDARDVPFLREDSKDAADIARINATTIRQLVDGGFEPGSAVAAVVAQDMTLLVPTGLLSVQLQKPGESAGAPPAAPVDNTDDGSPAAA